MLGSRFNGLYFVEDSPLSPKALDALQSLAHMRIPVHSMVVVPAHVQMPPMDGLTVISDAQGLMKQRFNATPGTFYLLRPDQHISARWRTLNADAVHAAVLRATSNA
jgi:3-(3-hydroxy-phenyl)propionate hydroxylase